jgi:hypothetical protein
LQIDQKHWQDAKTGADLHGCALGDGAAGFDPGALPSAWARNLRLAITALARLGGR